jgi:hypothetical protein
MKEIIEEQRKKVRRFKTKHLQPSGYICLQVVWKDGFYCCGVASGAG